MGVDVTAGLTFMPPGEALMAPTCPRVANETGTRTLELDNAPVRPAICGEVRIDTLVPAFTIILEGSDTLGFGAMGAVDGIPMTRGPVERWEGEINIAKLIPTTCTYH